MLNVITLMGRLTAEPELRHSANNVPVTSFTLAVERAYVKSGAERQADFIDVVVWRNSAEFVCKYFRKGQMIAVQGSLQTRTYTDKDGNKRKAVEVIADQVHFTGERREQKPDIEVPVAPAYSQGTVEDFEAMPVDDGDLPF